MPASGGVIPSLRDLVRVTPGIIARWNAEIRV